MERDVRTAIALFTLVACSVSVGYLFARMEQKSRFSECVERASNPNQVALCRALRPAPYFNPAPKGTPMTSPISRTRIPLEQVNSTQILAIGHDADTSTLAIQFRSGKQPLYHYGNVPVAVFNEFKNAGSQGSYFYREIKPHSDLYPYVRIDDDQDQPQAEAA